MNLDYEIKTVSLSVLYNIILEKQRAGYRLTQICATAFEGYNELIYSVSNGYEFENYKVTVPIDEEVNTISDFYPSAMLYENEMKELFGVKIKSINPDYKNKFYRIAKETPFKKEVKETVKIVKDQTKIVKKVPKNPPAETAPAEKDAVAADKDAAEKSSNEKLSNEKSADEKSSNEKAVSEKDAADSKSSEVSSNG